MLQRVAVCYSVLQCAAVCCSLFLVFSSALQRHQSTESRLCSALQCVAVRCSALQGVAVWCSVLQCVAVCCSVLQRVTVCCSVLQCVCSVFAVCLQCVCSMLQCAALHCSATYQQEHAVANPSGAPALLQYTTPQNSFHIPRHSQKLAGVQCSLHSCRAHPCFSAT